MAAPDTPPPSPPQRAADRSARPDDRWFRRPILPRLSARLALTMALACLPVGVLTYLNITALEDEMQGRAEEALMGNALRAAESKIGRIREAQGLMASAAQAVPLLLADRAACSNMMRNIHTSFGLSGHVGFIRADGQLFCSNQSREIDFSNSANFQQLRALKTPGLQINQRGQVTGESVLIVSHPVFDADGGYLGFVSVSIPHDELVQVATPSAPQPVPDIEGAFTDGREPWFFLIFDRTGLPLAASSDLASAAGRLPDDIALADLVGKPARVFRAHSERGFLRIYAVVPVIENELYLLSMWKSDVDSAVTQFRMTSYLSPGLMWLAAFLVAAIAAERLVARHVRTLHRAIRAFARGDRRLESIDLADAPTELRELGDTYLAMTETITRGEADLEDTVHQKEVLLREVHHRVKNNLQLIASIMNIQIRKTQSLEAKAMLKDLHDRVMSLSTIHRGLYVTTGQGDVSAAELLPDIARQISALALDPDRASRVTLDIADIRLVPDQAVPLALLLTEALNSAIRSGQRPAQVHVTLERRGQEGADACLTVRRAGPTAGQDNELGQLLIAAFCQQLRASLSQDETPDGTTLQVRFQISPLSAGENRHSPTA